MRDLKWIIGLLLICLLILAAVSFFIPPVSAYGIIQNTTNSYTIERIEQGSIVYINETYDISGVTGWSEKLAWYGASADTQSYDIDPVLVELPGRVHTAAKSQYYFKIDNDTFKTHPGKWFQYYGTEEKERGNLLAFEVVLNKPYKFSQSNTTKNLTYNTSSDSTFVTPIKTPALPKVRIADYLVARGDKFNITVNESTNAWLFGREDYLYDYRSLNNSIDIQGMFTSNLEIGSYKLLLQNKNNSYSDFTVRYNTEKDTVEWFDPKLFVVHELSLNGLAPKVALEKIKEIFPNSKDTYSLYTFEVQEPSITISRRDTIYVNGSTVLDIRGYTNAMPGTNITLTLDEDKQTPKTLPTYTFHGYAEGDFDGNMRYYQIYVPIRPMDMTNGMHTLKATTGIGGEMLADFPISEFPADSYVPNASVKYIGDRNPWIPTPTPEVITVVKEIPGPTVTVIVTVTPEETVVRAQQEKVIDEKISFWFPRIITTIIGLIVLVYLISVHLRRKDH